MAALEAPVASSFLVFVFSIVASYLGGLTATLITLILGFVISVWFQAGWLMDLVGRMSPRVTWRAWPQFVGSKIFTGNRSTEHDSGNEDATKDVKKEWGRKAVSQYPVDECGKPLIALTIDE